MSATIEITFKGTVSIPDEFNPGQQEPAIGANIKISRNSNQVTVIAVPVIGEINEIKNLEIGTYQIEISFVGYKTQNIIKQITATTKEINLGDIELVEDSELLDEVEVVTYEFKGTIIDSTDPNKTISGATVLSDTDNKDDAISQTDGTFKLSIQLDSTSLISTGGAQTERKYKQITAIASADGYSQSNPIQLIKGDGTLKQDLGFIKLTPIETELDNQIIQSKTLTETQSVIIKDNSKKDFISSIFKKMLRIIQDRLIPSILAQLTAFGVNKFNEEVLKNIDNIPKLCPPNIEELNKAIEQKNKLTKQLNNIFKFINQINKFLDIPPKIIEASDTAVTVAKAGVTAVSFIPSTLATPIPVGPILILKDLINVLEDLLDFLKNRLGGSIIMLRLILEELRKVLLLLNILDALIQSCAEGLNSTTSGNPNNNIEVQSAVSQELLNSTQQQSQQLSPVVTDVNGFKMSVITVENVSIGGLQRRRAIAQDKFGVTVLQGEPSFSSNDQILIDELVFYIQQNNLKAN